MRTMTEEQQKLVSENMGLCGQRVKSLVGWCGDYDDVSDICFTSMCTAAMKFNPNRGRFSTFVYRVMWTDVIRAKKQFEVHNVKAESLYGNEKYTVHKEASSVDTKSVFEIITKADLTKREKMVLRMRLDGCTYEFIRGFIKTSRQTVGNILRVIYIKINAEMRKRNLCIEDFYK